MATKASIKRILRLMTGCMSATVLLLHAALPAQAAPAPKAKAVIQIWLWGGPAHLDTFDPKPNAGPDYTGPFTKPIDTNVPGIQIGEMLPNLAKMADKYSIIRSMTHGIGGHETAAYMMQTGHAPGERLVYPTVGAVLSRFKGYDQGYKGAIPPYVILTTAQGRFSEIGFLDLKYKPLVTGGDPSQPRFIVEGISVEGITDKRQADRRTLLDEFDTLGKCMSYEPEFTLFDQTRAQAFETIYGEAGKLFDLSTEPAEVRDRYGRNKFGQSCLMARRLVENGVLYVTINYNGWDSHTRHFELMRRKLPEMDTGVSALLQDLSDRGLLDSTIVWWGGEFGRTPKIAWEAPWNGGRHHFGNCFSVMVAGGGFKGGHVVGSSDEKGEKVKERPVYPVDLLGSFYELLGIDPRLSLSDSKGPDVRVLPVGDDYKGQGILREIM